MSCSNKGGIMSEGEPDLSEFEALQPQKRLCVIATLPELLEPADLRNLHAAFKAGYSNRIVAQWLGFRGVKTSEGSVRKHRNGECSCE
jgi:hypothetical protein